MTFLEKRSAFLLGPHAPKHHCNRGFTIYSGTPLSETLPASMPYRTRRKECKCRNCDRQAEPPPSHVLPLCQTRAIAAERNADFLIRTSAKKNVNICATQGARAFPYVCRGGKRNGLPLHTEQQYGMPWAKTFRCAQWQHPCH